MALVFTRFSTNDIIELAQNPKYSRELERVSYAELELINEKIGKIISESHYDPKLFEKLLRLRSYIVSKLWST